MIEFAWPYVLIVLPLPLLIALFSPPAAELPRATLRIPFFAAIREAYSQPHTHNWRVIMAILAWLLLMLAATRPQWIGEPIQLSVSGRDLMLAVDISGSMRTEDMVLDDLQSNRLQVVQAVAGEFIERRQGDRLGLILFGSQAYLQTPLTFDRQTVRTLLDEAAIGLAGKETAIGDAIGLAVKRLRQLDSAATTATPTERVLVLLTDGANNAGVIDPERATELAAQQGLRIYTIGVGADEMVVSGQFGSSRVNPSIDLDEGVLRRIAQQTGGRYFRARDTGELESIYTLIDALEPIIVAEETFRPVRELYPWPLSAALLLSVLLTLFVGGWMSMLGARLGRAG